MLRDRQIRLAMLDSRGPPTVALGPRRRRCHSRTGRRHL